MRLTKIWIPVVFLSVILTMASCKKYLDKKPDNELVTPESISDLQGLLDNSAMGLFSYAAEILCDDYYLSTSDWNLPGNQSESSITPKNLHLWQRDDNTSVYWNSIYQNILITNIALDELSKMKYNPKQPADYNNVKGSAFFLRSFYFYHLAQSFAKSYNSNTATNDLGIVLRLNSDINEPSVRASVKESYDRIIKDLKSSVTLLPLKPLIKTRPSQPAAYGALARTYLVMKEYDSASKYADLCLLQYDSLMDYNNLTASSNTPFSKFNKEVIFSARSIALTVVLGTRAKIDSNLYKSYSDTDIRKQIFFKPASTGGGYLFKGDYEGVGPASPTNGTFFSFTGIVTDEIYLIKAESYARRNNLVPAMAALNKLLETRYKTGQFTPLTAATMNEALTLILKERRKELLRRGTRWIDIKRLIDEEQFRILPERNINNQVYSMTNNNSPYLMLLPKVVISLSGIPQN